MAEITGTGAHLTSTQLRVWTGLHNTARLLDHALEANLRANHGMTHREYEVLVRVDGAAGKIRMSVLARQIAASAALITQTVTRLEERGWIKRVASEGDARGIDAALTDQGRSVLAVAAKSHAELVLQLLVDRMGSHLDVVGDALTATASHLQGHRMDEVCSDSTCPLNDQ